MVTFLQFTKTYILYISEHVFLIPNNSAILICKQVAKTHLPTITHTLTRRKKHDDHII